MTPFEFQKFLSLYGVDILFGNTKFAERLKKHQAGGGGAVVVDKPEKDKITAKAQNVFSPVLKGKSGYYNGLRLYPTVQQEGTANYTGFYLSVYEESVGSGKKYLLNAGLNSAANGLGVHTSQFSVDRTGEVRANQFSVNSPNEAPASPTAPGQRGELRFTREGIFFCVEDNHWIKYAAVDDWQ